MPIHLIPVLLALAAVPTAAQRGRYMPPASVECDRNELTSFTGEAARYSRRASRIRLTLKTDEGTEETVTFGPGDKILLNAEPMKDEDWKQVEEKEGKLKAGMRATAWVCRGGRPVLDWQPPQR